VAAGWIAEDERKLLLVLAAALGWTVKQMKERVKKLWHKKYGVLVYNSLNARLVSKEKNNGNR